ncbi:hypothetical protein MRX96_033730 [Rhipicephalus microplus]
MWKHQNRRPGQATAHGGLRPTSSVIRGGSFEQHLAARHMMLHWLAIQKASAAVDTGPRVEGWKAVQRHRCSGSGQTVKPAQPLPSCRHGTCYSRPIKCRTTGHSHVWRKCRGATKLLCDMQNQLAQRQHRTIQPNLKEEEDHSGTLERSTPYLNFLARLTEHLVHQPDLSDEALHGACEKYIATEANGLDQDVLWNLVRELFSELYHSKYPAC